MTPTQLVSTLAAANCEVAFDTLTRRLYATDASLYQVEPIAVAFPKGSKQTSSIMHAAAQAGIPIIPRGAGTGLAGGAIGEGLVIDFSRYNRQIYDLEVEERTVSVGPGVVLDQLNHVLRPHGLCFGPDVASGSRATLGGMIANNSSGAHALVYGTTADHVKSLELVLSDGRYAKVGGNWDTMPRQRELLENIVQLNSLLIEERFPAGLLKRWPGYALDRCLRDPGNLLNVLCGSEGTLAAIVSAELKLVPLPREKGMAVLFFHSAVEAMQAAVELLDLKPAAIEHLDRVLLDETKGQLAFQSARDLLELDQLPCESILVIEFFDGAHDRLSELSRRKLGCRKKVLHTQAGADLVWSLRHSALSLLTGRKGAAKPLTGIEDTAVRPDQLPEYLTALQSLLQKMEVEASCYGHAGAGLLHVRPILNLRSREDRRKLRDLATEVAALVRHFKGSFAAEHGVGMARTELMPDLVGTELLNLMQEIKGSFDPHYLLNPGKIIPDGRYQIDEDLRTRPGHEMDLPFEPVLAFSSKDESFVGNLEQCNGCGACLKLTPTMCPTFMVTGEEVMSTRGRANAIRAALELRQAHNGALLGSEELEAALSNCLSCKACKKECPSNVDMALLKAEMQWARIRQNGLSLRERLFSSPDLFGRIGCKVPWLVNTFLDSPLMRFVGSKLLGITSRRPLPHYAKQRFDHWYFSRGDRPPGYRGRVVLWDDTYVRYHEPHIGAAAVKVLEAAGFDVALPLGRQCCGRPAFSQGNLAEATRLGEYNIHLLNQDVDNAPILFLEPSCFSMFKEDYRELKLAHAERIAERCFLFQDFISALLDRESNALKFESKSEKIIIHVHCHIKAMMDTAFMNRLADRLPGRTVEVLDTGCCGMAGAFGMLESKYQLSVKVADPLIQAVKAQPYGTVFVTSGASCRQQVLHLTPIRSSHIAEVLADALRE